MNETPWPAAGHPLKLSGEEEIDGGTGHHRRHRLDVIAPHSLGVIEPPFTGAPTWGQRISPIVPTCGGGRIPPGPPT